MDLSGAALQALDVARGLARSFGSTRIVVAHAYYVPPELVVYAPDHVPGYLEALSDQAQKRLRGSVDELNGSGIESELVAERGSPEQVILATAERQGADLIVMGTHARKGLAHFALGSVAARVVQHAKCPVLTVKEEA